MSSSFNKSPPSGGVSHAKIKLRINTWGSQLELTHYEDECIDMISNNLLIYLKSFIRAMARQRRQYKTFYPALKQKSLLKNKRPLESGKVSSDTTTMLESLKKLSPDTYNIPVFPDSKSNYKDDKSIADNRTVGSSSCAEYIHESSPEDSHDSNPEDSSHIKSLSSKFLSSNSPDLQIPSCEVGSESIPGDWSDMKSSFLKLFPGSGSSEPIFSYEFGSESIPHCIRESSHEYIPEETPISKLLPSSGPKQSILRPDEFIISEIVYPKDQYGTKDFILLLKRNPHILPNRGLYKLFLGYAQKRIRVEEPKKKIKFTVETD